MTPECPDCGGSMTLRINRETQDKFWGCRDFPDCWGTRPANAEEPDAMPSDRHRQNDARRWRE